MPDLSNALGAEFRQFGEREHEGKPARVAVASRIYSTDPGDLWDALTRAERIQRWFLPISGDLRLGGRYQLQGNAGGTITRCEAPKALDVTWEFGGGTSWVSVRLEPDGAGTRLTLEHIMPIGGVGEEHWNTYGPGAVGVGWDLAFLGLGMYLDSDGAEVDRQAVADWMAADAGKDFVRACARSWGDAHVAAGGAPEIAHGMAERTAAFYAGG